MLSVPDMALLGAAALLLFGPDQLPRVARKAGNVMREIQNTSQSFIREMERAADVAEANEHKPSEQAAEPYEPAPYDASPFDVTAPFEAVGADDSTGGSHPNGSASGYEPASPDPDPPAVVKLAEPRPAADRQAAEYEHDAEPFDPPPRTS
ncbi:MAG: twin-arginine translocase TatA/TatE family subunit [Candidatus Elarobacter sp.]